MVALSKREESRNHKQASPARTCSVPSVLALDSATGDASNIANCAMPVEFKTRQGDVFYVSACDVPLVTSYRSFRTHCTLTGHTSYVRGWSGGSEQYLHRVILRPPKGMLVDHIDGDGMNCTRQNMRICTPQQNSWNSRKRNTNTSGYIGVVWSVHASKWCAQILHNSWPIRLGYYTSAEAAARAYDEKCIELRGEFAALNFPIIE